MLLELCSQLAEEESAAKAVRLTSIAQVVWCVKMAEQTMASGADAGDAKGNILGMAHGVAAAAEKQDDLLQRLGRCLTELEQLAAKASATPVLSEVSAPDTAAEATTEAAAEAIAVAGAAQVEPETAASEVPAEEPAQAADAFIPNADEDGAPPAAFPDQTPAASAAVDGTDGGQQQQQGEAEEEEEEEIVNMMNQAMALGTPAGESAETEAEAAEVVESGSESEEEEVIDLLAGGAAASSAGGLWGEHSQAADDKSFEAEQTARAAAKVEAFEDESNQARAWMSAVLGRPVPAGAIDETLKNGVILCEVRTQPG